MTATLDDWITIDEASARTGICRRQIRNYIYQHLIKFRQFGNRHYLVYWPSLEALRKSRAAALTRKLPQVTA